MRFLKSISDTLAILNRPIYVGKRLEDNLKALSFAGAFFAIVGLFLIFVNFSKGHVINGIASTATFFFGGACWFCASILKRRDLAIIMPTLFCMVAFTIYTLTGMGEGSFILWTFTLPIGICYFVSVKYGIFLSVYYTILFVIVFYTPIGNSIKALYSHSFANRFPLLYGCTAVLTAAAMIQYHRGILLENEYADRLNEEVEKQTKKAKERANRLDKLNEEMVETLAVTIDAKDKYTNGHSFRVSWYSVALARQLGWTEEEIDELEREALLHDIGKIGVPDSVLNKPDRLTDEEYAVIKSHTTIGGEILSRSENLKSAAEVAHYHHERYDGNGYPDRLSGEEIPLHARVVAIADAYDAMRSDRIYRRGLPLDVIREELIKWRGKQFDPGMLDRFLELTDNGVLDEIAGREIPK